MLKRVILIFANGDFLVLCVAVHEAGPMACNVSICVRAGLPKPRGVPDTERTKDTKTLDYASTPLDANTLLCAGRFVPRSRLSLEMSHNTDDY